MVANRDRKSFGSRRKNPEFAQTTGTVDVSDPRLGRPGRGATEVEKSPRLNWATQFFTVAYECAHYPNVSVRMARISFGALPCRKKKLNDNSRLDVVEIARVT